jgi:PiT family inorganic phosphate transporter
LVAAGVFASGVLLGGRRLLRRFGMKFYRIRDMQGVGAQMSSALTLLGCLASGFPASTTQLMSGSIVGAGVAKNVRSVRWAAVGEIILSWVVTVPVTTALGATLALAVTAR